MNLQPTKLAGHAYIAGPMTNLPNFNFDAFDAVAQRCRHYDGWTVFNPHEHDQETYPGIDQAAATQIGDVQAIAVEVGFNFKDAMTWDLQAVAVSEHLVLLPGWENSTGAKAERFVGEMTGSVVWLAHEDPEFGWILVLDEEQKRLVAPQLPSPDVEYDLSRASGMLKPVEVVDNADQATVIGLMGYAQVGKDTLASQLVEKHGFTRIAFADVLRDCLYALNPIVFLNIDASVVRLQTIVDAIGWDEAKVRYPEIRALLQRLGTEVGREILGNDIWVNTALAQVKPGGKYVITDMRFPNEYAAVHKLGGKMVRVVREGYGPVNDHWSETALDGYEADVTLVNDRTPADLLMSLLACVGLVQA